MGSKGDKGTWHSGNCHQETQLGAGLVATKFSSVRAAGCSELGNVAPPIRRSLLTRSGVGRRGEADRRPSGIPIHKTPPSELGQIGDIGPGVPGSDRLGEEERKGSPRDGNRGGWGPPAAPESRDLWV